MKVIKGDLIKKALEGQFDVIIHGCNCFCTMGAGIAAQIKFSFPAAYNADLITKRGDINKLGTFSTAQAYGITIVNAYTQYKYGEGIDYANYAAIKKVFAIIKQQFSGLRIGYPKIGSGLAGGDWSIISAIIDLELKGEDHTLVIYE